jgi:hypothetical protein
MDDHAVPVTAVPALNRPDTGWHQQKLATASPFWRHYAPPNCPLTNDLLAAGRNRRFAERPFWSADMLPTRISPAICPISDGACPLIARTPAVMAR